MTPRSTSCDSCHGEIHRDETGYWVGEDDTSDCPASDRGHTLDGAIR